MTRRSPVLPGCAAAAARISGGKPRIFPYLFRVEERSAMERPLVSAARAAQSCMILLAVLGLGAVRAAADVDIDLFAAGADTLTLTSPGMANNAMPAWPT